MKLPVLRKEHLTFSFMSSCLYFLEIRRSFPQVLLYWTHQHLSQQTASLQRGSQPHRKGEKLNLKFCSPWDVLHAIPLTVTGCQKAVLPHSRSGGILTPQLLCQSSSCTWKKVGFAIKVVTLNKLLSPVVYLNVVWTGNWTIKVGIHYLSYQLFLSEVVYQREKYNAVFPNGIQGATWVYSKDICQSTLE